MLINRILICFHSLSGQLDYFGRVLKNLCNFFVRFYWLALKATFIISCMCIHCQTQRWVVRAVDLSFVNILKPPCLDLRWVKNSCCSKSFPITYMAGSAIGTMVTNSIFLFSGSKELELVATILSPCFRSGQARWYLVFFPFVLKKIEALWTGKPKS